MRLIPTLLVTLLVVGCTAERPTPPVAAAAAAPETPVSIAVPAVAEPVVTTPPAPTAVTTEVAPAEVPDTVLATIDAALAAAKIDPTKPKWRLNLPKPTVTPTYLPAKSYLWTLDTTAGRVVVLLDPAAAPQHVTSTIWLTRLGFYDQLAFHRVIKGFMAQGGCPLGTGTGGPGYTYGGEFLTKRRHDRPGL